MTPIRLGAVGYLNARPLVHGLDRDARFAVRFDVPSRCAELLHEGAIDVGLIPSIEYLRGDYRIVPDLAIASRGPVASVNLYTTTSIGDVRSIALDASSRTSVALTRVLCAKVFAIAPRFESLGPDLDAMLDRCDAALLIGDGALTTDPPAGAHTIDLGDVWTKTTGLPFVYAFWAGRPNAVEPSDVAALRRARDEGVRCVGDIARAYFAGAADKTALGARYLRDNIKYDLGADERRGLELFYRYAVDVGVMPAVKPLQFYRVSRELTPQDV